MKPTLRRPWLSTAGALCLGMVTSCSAFTPASDGPADPNPATDQTLVPAQSPDESVATPPSTLDLPDPLWQELKLDLVPIAQVEAPTDFTARSGSLNYYIAERAGRVRVVDRTITLNGSERMSLDSQPVLDISERVSTDGEQGLLGIAFSSDGRQLYVSYTALNGDSVVSEFIVSRSDRADLESERELLRVPQPFSNHNGGTVRVGEDGFLYIGLGDGGGAGDPDQNGQNLDSFLGKVLRIDPFPDGDRPYSLPNGNPFFDDDRGLPEIWLWGVRNPWKLSFDSLNGDLWLADVGQDRFEEINLLPASTGGGYGANLGWSEMDGYETFEGGSVPEDHQPPLYAYPHEQDRCSVTGGAMYRGEIIALLQGVYLFGDFCTGEIFGLEPLPEGPLVRQLGISVGAEQLASFGVGPQGEMFVLELVGPEGMGVVHRIEPTQAEVDS